MLKRGILAGEKCYSNYCHEEKDLKIYENSCHEIFLQIAKHLSKGDLEKKLEGPIKQMGFNRLTEIN